MTDIERPGPAGTKDFTKRNGSVIKVVGYDPEEIAAYRKSRGVSQQELADKLGEDRATVSFRETAFRQPFIGEEDALAHLDAIDLLAKLRSQMVAEGLKMTAKLAAESREHRAQRLTAELFRETSGGRYDVTREIAAIEEGLPR